MTSADPRVALVLGGSLPGDRVRAAPGHGLAAPTTHMAKNCEPPP
ncbi:hypothetical protein FHX69_3315 [Prauserella muralis]|nr:hypothetical protein FHX69_3315 [Prauserella muralis]